MVECFTDSSANASIVHLIAEADYNAWLDKQDSSVKAWLQANAFTPEAGQFCCLPDATCKIFCTIAILKNDHDFWQIGALPDQLPLGIYQLHWVNEVAENVKFNGHLAFALGSYRFEKYKQVDKPLPKLLLPDNLNVTLLKQWVESIYLVRDLINTPAGNMQPKDLALAVTEMGEEFQARVSVISGDELLVQNYPAIHAVGRAGTQEPCLIDLHWGDQRHPKLTLIGKGVCFDTGGLDLKPPSSMRLMKKDMAGGAHALGLARMIMLNKLPVRLRLLIPAVENAVGGCAYRPGDVIKTRAGKTVEIDNTDAEGRVILCDALTEAVKDQSDLIVDFATLTGAAFLALGPQLPALFCNDDQTASDILQASRETQDLMWRMPLHQPYLDYLKSDIADLLNAAGVRNPGAITAALYLQSFVSDDINWVHFDFSAWQPDALPGRPKGGDVFTLRAMFHYLQQRYS